MTNPKRPEKKDLNYYAMKIFNEWNKVACVFPENTGYFFEWNKVAYVFPENTGYYFEIKSVIEDIISMCLQKQDKYLKWFCEERLEEILSKPSFMNEMKEAITSELLGEDIKNEKEKKS